MSEMFENQFNPSDNPLARMGFSRSEPVAFLEERELLRSHFSKLTDENGLFFYPDLERSTDLFLDFLAPLRAQPLFSNKTVIGHVSKGASNRDKSNMLYLGDVVIPEVATFFIPTLDFYSGGQTHAFAPLMMPPIEEIGGGAGLVFKCEESSTKVKVGLLMTEAAFFESLEVLNDVASKINSGLFASQIGVGSVLATLLIGEAQWARKRHSKDSENKVIMENPSSVLCVSLLTPPDESLMFELHVGVIPPSPDVLCGVGVASGGFAKEQHLLKLERSEFGEVTAHSIEYRAFAA